MRLTRRERGAGHADQRRRGRAESVRSPGATPLLSSRRSPAPRPRRVVDWSRLTPAEKVALGGTVHLK